MLSSAELRQLRTRGIGAPPPAPEHVTRRLKVCGIGQPQPRWCECLSDDGTYCEKIVDDTCKICQRAGKFHQFIADMNSRCPLRKW